MFSVEKHYPAHNEQIYNFIYFLTFNHSLAEDLLQETFLRAYQARHTYRGDANVLTWLRKIAKHVVLDHMKSKKKYFWQTYDSLNEQSAIAPSAEELAGLSERKRELYMAIGQLKLEHRLAVVLRKIEGLSIHQTAQILDWNEAKVKNNTERGMKELETLMKGGEMDGKRTSAIESSFTQQRPTRKNI